MILEMFDSSIVLATNNSKIFLCLSFNSYRIPSISPQDPNLARRLIDDRLLLSDGAQDVVARPRALRDYRTHRVLEGRQGTQGTVG